MSWQLLTYARTRKAGSLAEKSVLLHLASLADDDGTRIYQAKAEMARALGCVRNTVINSIAALERKGIVVEVGKRKTPNGFVYEYKFDLEGLQALPPAHERHRNIRLQKRPAQEASTTCAGRAHDPAQPMRTTNHKAKKKEDCEAGEKPEPTGMRKTRGDCREKQSQADAFCHYWAKKINDGAPISPSALKPNDARKMLEMGLVNEDALRRAGITY